MKSEVAPVKADVVAASKERKNANKRAGQHAKAFAKKSSVSSPVELNPNLRKRPVDRDQEVRMSRKKRATGLRVRTDFLEKVMPKMVAEQVSKEKIRKQSDAYKKVGEEHRRLAALTIEEEGPH